MTRSFVIVGILLLLIISAGNAQNNFKAFDQEITVDTTVQMEQDTSISRTLRPYTYTKKDSLGNIYTTVQNPPEFPGGNKAYYEFLDSNFRYPQEAIDKDISGTVWVYFLVEKDGTISNVKIIPGKGLDKSCNEEAIRVVSMMPKWKPGIHDGKPVRTKHQLGISFVLEGPVKNKRRK